MVVQVSHKFQRIFQADRLQPPRDFEQPVILATIFKTMHENMQQNNRLIVEIGAGKGKHALQYATAHPDDTVIAIERTANKFRSFARQLQKLQTHNPNDYRNLLPIHADAIAWTVYALPPASVSIFYLLYPNPEPKNPNQQWLNMPFFEFLLSRLQAGGQIVLATNIASYMDNAEQQAIETWQLACKREQVPEDSQRTHFEVKYLARGETCWQLTMQKPMGYVTRFDDFEAKLSESE